MDLVIYYRIMAILAELAMFSPIIVVDDFDPDYSIRNYGPYRLYDIHLDVRDDVDTSELAADLCTVLEKHNKISNIKVDFYEVNEYPGPARNWHTVYLTVVTI